jgi:DNA-binding transcriptional MerR regulator
MVTAITVSDGATWFTGRMPEPDVDDTDDDDDRSYGLAELAARSGVSARTIRFYQSERVLPRPDRRGRDAVYGDDHLERLRLIAELRDRGLGLSAIRHLLDRRASPGMSVGDWLGLDETLRGPWSEDRAEIVTDEQLLERLGDRPAGVHASLERAGYLEAVGQGTWLVRSPTLLGIALQLQDAGIDIEVTGEATELLRRRLSRAVDDLIDLFVQRSGAGFAGSASRDELVTALGTLRPLAREAAGVILAHEVERGLRALLEAGPAAIDRRSGAAKARRRR